MSKTGVPEALQEGHTRLRGGKKRDGTDICTGTGFAIQRGLSLGGSRTTDVFELQLTGLDDPGTALSIGIAVRRAFCRGIGIEEQEVGVSTRPARGRDESILQSIFLYDTATGGNGYVAGLRDHVARALRECVQILDCGKKCDAACHGCLLTFDTQYDSAKLDRHDGLAFLTGDWLGGLELQEHDRLLGESSQVLTRPLYRHLAEVAGEPDIEEIRIWLGDDADAWDVEVFPLYRHLLRWIENNLRVRLFVAPSTWSGLSEGSRHALAALVTAGQGGMEVHRAGGSRTDCGHGTVIAAVGGRNTCIKWAVPGTGEPAMNDTWGKLPTGGVSVYAVIDEALPAIETAAVTEDELRPQPEGTEAILPIKDELNGRIEEFGSRFWTHVLKRCGGLERQFEENDSLARVTYSDRYITTPWALVLLREILLDLIRHGRADLGTELKVLTRELRNTYRPGREAVRVSDSFQEDAARESVFEQAMGTGRGTVRWIGPRRLEAGLTPHFRELRLQWRDGTAWSLLLDQGVSYWQCRPRVEFPFKSTAEEQLKRLNAIVKRDRVTSVGGYPTYIYITKASRDR